MDNSILIKKPCFTTNEKIARVSVEIHFPDGIQALYFECDAEHADKISADTSDSFLISILPVAMRKGLDIRVEGNVSSKLYYNITNYYIEVLRNLLPETNKIKIHADHLTRELWGGKGVFSGFSAGVDSFCSIFDHLNENVPTEYKITHLLFNDVGAHGQAEDDKKFFKERIGRLREVAIILGLPIIEVRSNLDELMNTKFQLTHTIRNVAVALMFQKACGKFLYGSAGHYRYVYVKPTNDIGWADLLSLPLVCTETIDCISSGGQHDRFEKIEIISRSELTYNTLDICVAPWAATKAINCSKCWKCLRTQFTLEVIGKLDKYRSVFHIDVYQKFRIFYICYVLQSSDPLLMEIQRGIKRYDFKIPLSATLMNKFIPRIMLAKLFNRIPWLIGGH